MQRQPIRDGGSILSHARRKMFIRRYRHNRAIQKLVVFLIATGAFFLTPSTAYAVCPICTVAVGAGLGLSRYLGIDDSVTGIWVGGLMVSLTLWLVDWLSKKNWKFLKNISSRTRIILSFAFWVLLTYPPLFWAGIIGHPFNTILGVDKLVFGSIIGAIAFIIGVWADKKVRKIRGGQFFTYQKVVFPVLALAMLSLVLYFYGGYLYGLN